LKGRDISEKVAGNKYLSGTFDEGGGSEETSREWTKALKKVFMLHVDQK